MDPFTLHSEDGQPLQRQYLRDPTANLTAEIAIGTHPRTSVSSGSATYLLTVRREGAGAPLLLRADTMPTVDSAEQAAYRQWRDYCRRQIEARTKLTVATMPRAGGVFPGEKEQP